MEGAEAADPEEPVGRTGKTESDAAHCDAPLGAYELGEPASSLRGGGASPAYRAGEKRTAVPEAVTMSMPLSVPSVS